MRPWTAAVGSMRCYGGRSWSRAWSARASWSRPPLSWTRCAPMAVRAGYLQQALAWLDGWLAEQARRPRPGSGDLRPRRGHRQRRKARQGTRPRLQLAYGHLLRRTGQRRLAVERLRRANDLYQALRAEPFIARTEEELAACHLPGSPAKKRSVH